MISNIPLLNMSSIICYIMSYMVIDIVINGYRITTFIIFGGFYIVNELTDKVIGAAIEVHRILGPGLLESIYEEALCTELSLRDISFERQKEVEVVYKGRCIKGQRVDLVVEKVLVVELKAVANLPRQQRLRFFHI